MAPQPHKKCFSTSPLILRPSAESTAWLSGEQGTDFLSRNTRTLLFLMEAQQSEDTLTLWLRIIDSCSPPGTWENSSLTSTLSRLSHRVRPGSQGFLSYWGGQNSRDGDGTTSLGPSCIVGLSSWGIAFSFSSDGASSIAVCSHCLPLSCSLLLWGTASQ